MNARTIRRALKRKAEKQARKAQQQAVAASASTTILEFTDEAVAERSPASTNTVSASQLEANRRNSLLSTGPVTPAGKAASSRNALKTGLTGRTVLLPNEDAALYASHVESFFAELKPVGDRERELAQAIADSKWRLARIPGLEFGIYALGRLQFAEEFRNHAPAEAAALIEAKTFLTYQRQLNNLSIQESRLRRQCDKDTAELLHLQQLRAAADKAQAALTTPKPRANTPQPPEQQANGFEISSAESCRLDASIGQLSALLSVPQAA